MKPLFLCNRYLCCRSRCSEAHRISYMG